MSRYETISNLGDDLIKLMGKGIIPVHILDWKVYYEAYVKQKESLLKEYGKPRKTWAAGMVADEYDISERTMFSVISFMEG